MVYATVRHESFTVRYRRCSSCHRTSKTIQLKKILSSIPVVDVATVDADTFGVSQINTKEIQ
jgi:ubiquitin C-terminal hydrolase